MTEESVLRQTEGNKAEAECTERLSVGGGYRSWRRLASLLAILALSAVIVIPFACSQQFGGHDLEYHMSVIFSLDEAWKSGTFTSKIVSLICADYGYATGMFYTTIPAGTTVILMNVFGLDVVGAVAVFYFLLFAVGGMAMYGFCLRVFRRNAAALACSLFYTMFPYFITDLYVRFAFGESVMIANIPLVVWGIYELIGRRNRKLFFPLFIAGYSLSVLSHLTMTFYLTIFVAVYILLHFRTFIRRYTWLFFALAAFVVLLVTASFYVPLLVNIGVTQAGALSRNGMHLWRTSADIFLHSEYIPSTVALFFTYALACVVHFRRPKAERRPLRKYFIFFTLVIWAVTPAFPWFLFGFAPFNMIQFPWRLFLFEAVISVLQLGYILQFGEKALFKALAAVGVSLIVCVSFLCRGIVFTGRTDAPYRRDALSPEHISTFCGAGSSKSGDYFPKTDWEGSYYDYAAYRVNGNIILSSDIQVREFADYTQLGRISFLISDVESGGVTFRIPYAVAEGNRYFVEQVKNPNATLPADVSGVNADGTAYLHFEFENLQGDHLVFIDYSENAAMRAYLAENPFAFVVREGQARLSGFEKENTTTYTVGVEVTGQARIELPTLYYKGYTITLTDAEGNTETVKGIHGANGFIEVVLEDTAGILSVSFAPPYIGLSAAASVAGTVFYAALCCGVPVLYGKERSARKKARVAEQRE